jgi:hypothetical protein
MHHILQGVYQFSPFPNPSSSIKSSITPVFQAMRRLQFGRDCVLNSDGRWQGVRGLDWAAKLKSYARFPNFLRFVMRVSSIASIFSVNVAQWQHDGF